MKLSVLILLDMDKGYDEIEAILGIGHGSISNCRKKYESDGLEKYLDRHYVRYLGKLSEEELKRLDSEVSSGIYSSAQEVQGYILQTFGIEYSLSAVRLIDAVHRQHNTSSTYAWIKRGEKKAIHSALAINSNEQA